MSQYREGADAGGLISYRPSFTVSARRLGTYVDKILKGAIPAGPSNGATDGVRAGHQPQDGEGARPDDPAVAPAAGGSGDRIAHVRRCRPSMAPPHRRALPFDDLPPRL